MFHTMNGKGRVRAGGVKLLCHLLLLLLPVQGVWALGLGPMEIYSGLNEPLDARIRVDAAEADLEQLRVQLGSVEQFARVRLDRPAFLNRIEFELELGAKGNYILLSTTRPVREPFLNFLVQVSWRGGRLIREYALLFDPPGYEQSQQSEASAESVTHPGAVSPPKIKRPRPPGDLPAAASAGGTGTAGKSRPAPRAPPSPGSASTATTSSVPAPVARALSSAQGRLGATPYTVQSGDTLWSLAAAARPNRSVSVQQMMFALLHKNPEAFFLDSNINALRSGKILRMPSAEEINALNRAQAFAQTAQHNHLWDAYKGTGTARGPARPPVQPGRSGPVAGGPAVRPPSGTRAGVRASTDTALAKPEVRVLPNGNGNGSAKSANGNRTRELQNQLKFTEEELESRKQELGEVSAKLTSSETLIQDLQKKLALQNDQLSQMQQNVIESRKQAELSKQRARTLGEQAVLPAPVQKAEPPAKAAPPAPVQKAEPPAKAAPPAPVQKAEPPAKAAPPAPVQKAEPPAKAAPPAPVQETEPPAEAVAEPSLLSKVTGPIKSAWDSIALPFELGVVELGAALGLLLAAVGGFIFIRRRRAAADDDFDLDMGDIGDDILLDEGDALEDIAAEAAAPTEDIADQDATQMPEPEVDAEAEAIEMGGDAMDLPELEEGDLEFTAHEDVDEESEARMAEVNVLMAYGQFDRAAEFVQEAIGDEPDNQVFHLKLLEIYSVMNDPAAFENAARALQEKSGGSGEHWNSAMSMWQDMNTGREIFTEDAAAKEDMASTQRLSPELARQAMAEAEGAAAPDVGESTDEMMQELAAGSGADLRLGDAADSSDSKELPPLEFGGLDDSTAESPSLDIEEADTKESLSLDLEGEADTKESLSLDLEEEADTEESLSLDLEEEADTEELPSLDIEGAADAEELPSLDIEGAADAEELPSLDIEGAADTEELPSLSLEDAGEMPSLEFAMEDAGEATDDSADAMTTEEGDGSGAAAADALEVEMTQLPDDSGAALEMDLDIEPEAEGEEDTTGLNGGDDASTKLDLARAYMELGDAENARSSLQEVMSEGDAAQQSEAQELLSRLS